MIGLAVFGAAVGVVLILVLRMGRKAAVPAAPVASAAPPNRFGLGAPASDPSAYAVSAAPAAAMSAPAAAYPPPPPAAAYPPPPVDQPAGPPPGYGPPPAAEYPTPAPFPAPPAWGQPFGGAPLPDQRPAARKPFLVVGGVIGALMLSGAAFGAGRYFLNELNPLEQPAELGGLSVASGDPTIQGMVDATRKEIERDGTNKPVVAFYGSFEQIPAYFLAAGRNQGYDNRDEAISDFSKGLSSDGVMKVGGRRIIATSTGHDVECFSMTGLPIAASGCVWLVKDTAGFVLAFGQGELEKAATITAEAMEKSGVV